MVEQRLGNLAATPASTPSSAANTVVRMLGVEPCLGLDRRVGIVAELDPVVQVERAHARAATGTSDRSGSPRAFHERQVATPRPTRPRHDDYDARSSDGSARVDRRRAPDCDTAGRRQGVRIRHGNRRAALRGARVTSG